MFKYINDLNHENFDYHLNECKEMLEYLNEEKQNVENLLLESSINDVVKRIKNYFASIITKLINTWENLITNIESFLKYAKKKYYKLFINDDRKRKEKLMMSFSFGMKKDYYSLKDAYIGYTTSLSAIIKNLKRYSKECINDMKKISSYNIELNSYIFDDIIKEHVYDADVVYTDYSGTEFDAVFQENIIFDQLKLENTKILKTKDLEKLQKLQKYEKDIFEALKKQTLDDIEKLFQNKEYNELRKVIDVDNPALGELYYVYKNHKKDFRKYGNHLLDESLPVFTNINEDKDQIIRDWIEFRIARNNAIRECLEIMIICDNHFFGNDLVAKYKLYLAVQKEDYTEFNKLFSEEKWFYRHVTYYTSGVVMDFSEFTPLPISSNIQTDNNKCIILVAKNLENEAPEHLRVTNFHDGIYTYISQYNAVIIGHGDYRHRYIHELYKEISFSKALVFQFTKRYENTLNFYRKVTGKNYPDFTVKDEMLCSSLLYKKYSLLNTYSNSELKERYNIGRLELLKTDPFPHRRWSIDSSLCVPDPKDKMHEMIDTEMIIYLLLLGGYKKINVLSCNEERVKLDQSIYDDSSVYIRMRQGFEYY